MTRDVGQDQEVPETLPGFQNLFGEAQDLATAAKQVGVDVGDKGAHKVHWILLFSALRIGFACLGAVGTCSLVLSNAILLLWVVIRSHDARRSYSPWLCHYSIRGSFLYPPSQVQLPQILSGWTSPTIILHIWLHSQVSQVRAEFSGMQ